MRAKGIAIACVMAAGVVSMRTAPSPLAAAPAGTVDPTLLQALRYRAIGPHRGGRSTAVAGVAGDFRTFYMGASGGGLWKTTDAGEVWENVSDRYFKSGSIGAIAVAESNPNIVYAGTGSACLRNNIEIGNGSYKSTDAGATWQSIGLEDAGQIARIRVDPKDPDRVYVAALGHAFGPNATRGVFRSKDGGRNWEKVLYVNEKTGAADLSMDAHDSSILYATMWTGELKPWGLPSTSMEGGVFKTTDGGDHWTKLTEGLPKGPVGRIGVAVSAATPNRVFALVDATDGGVFRSEDGGKSFTRVNTDRELTGRSSYYAHIFADTKDANIVYAANRDFYRSTDGGATFAPIPMPHGDNHDLWIDPRDSKVMIQGNDGGATISLDGGKSWSTQLNQPTAEMYRVTTDDRVPYRVYGAQQDQYDAMAVPSRTANFGSRLSLQHWYAVGGYEGGFVAVDPRNPDIVYSGGPGGLITRYDHASTHLRTINEEAGRASKYRFAWNAPIFISPLDPENVYHTSNVVHRTSNGGQSWTIISPDLTRNDKSRQAAFGTGGEGGEAYPTISAFQESRKERGVFWAGSDDGYVHVSRDNGANWKNVTPKDLPELATINTIEPSPHDPGRAFLAAFRYKLDDYKPYIYRTDDYGDSWTLLTDGTNGIPSNQPVRVVREDPVRKGLLYAGTEFGMFWSMDDGKRWQSLQQNLPATPVTDITVHDSDVVLSTNGRSFWILDDVTPLRELAAQPFTDAHLFKPRDTYRISTSADEDEQAYVGGVCCVSNVRDIYTGARIERHQLGEEPPDGAIVYVSLPRVPAERVTLTIVGAGNKPVRTLIDTSRAGRSADAPALTRGLNRIAWDLRVDPAVRRPGFHGPKVVPGNYEVRLTIADHTERAPFKVLADPRFHLTAVDYQQQFDLLSELSNAMADVQKAAAALREHRGRAQPSGAAVPSESRAAALQALERQLGSEGGGRGGGRGGSPAPLFTELNGLYDFVAGSEARPTDAAVARWNDLRKTLGERMTELKNLIPDAGTTGRR